MKQLFTTLIILLFCTGSIDAQLYKPVPAPKQTHTDTFFQHYVVHDHYRWLEDVRSTETMDWVEQQNAMSGKYLQKAVNKTNSSVTIDKYAYTRYSRPRKVGPYYFSMMYYNNASAAALYYKHALTENYRLLVNPNDISKTDKINILGYDVSRDSLYTAYMFNRNGSDWMEIKVVSMKTEWHIKDHLKGMRNTSLHWLKDGFYYTKAFQDKEFGQTYFSGVFYHKLGTPQSEDKLVYGRKDGVSRNIAYLTSSDDRYFVVKEKNLETNKTNIFYIDHQMGKPYLQPLVLNLTRDPGILDVREGKFLVVTETHSVMLIDPADPYNWKTLIPAFSDAVLMKVVPFSDRIVATFRNHHTPLMAVYDYEGKQLFGDAFPAGTSLYGFSGAFHDKELLYSYESYTIPPVVYSFNTQTFKKKLTKQTTVNYEFDGFVSKTVEYKSKDGTTVPMLLVYDEKAVQQSNNPTLLKAYGGFGATSAPGFDPGIVYFIKKGGVFAFANIRGGGDKGTKWAEMGRGEHKQNSFDDFIAAAEFLIQSGYTSPEKLAITGASNGGLVVAAAAMQRLDLFKAVVVDVAPLDMLRFEQFTIGFMHDDEYGSIEDSASFVRLKSYSPYHNIQDTVNYPSMLIITSDHDDRVPPLHSYKFAAALQNRKVQENPVLLKVNQKAGHYGELELSGLIREKAHLYGFVWYELTK